jgi:flagellar biosynthesis protein FlhB
MAEDSDLEKTESASPRRIEQAREEGNVPHSRELSTFLVLMSGSVGLWVSAQWLYQRVGSIMRDGLTMQREQVLHPEMMFQTLMRLSTDALIAIAPLLLISIVAAVASPVFVGGLVFSSKAFSADFSRINPISGLGRIISMQGLAELVKGLLKSALIGSVGAMVLWKFRFDLLALLAMPLGSGLEQFGHLLLIATLSLAGSLAVVAMLDVPFQLWQYYHRLKMTKEELKQEHKEQEGDPHIKARIRARQREMARNRMMESVPKADVVVTNPTHYAVALKYEAGRMSAPKVVAKGADLVAKAIRDLATENGVPLLEAPPLARALFRHAEIGDQIPAALYTAVAEVMAYVYQLNHFIAEGGLPPEQPHDLPVPADMDPGHARAMVAQQTDFIRQ